MTQPPQQWGPPAPPQWAPPPPPMPPSPLPLQPTSYPQFWRAPGILAWRPIVAVLLTAVVFLVLAAVVTGVAVGIEVATGAIDPDVLLEMLERAEITPGLVLANSIAIGLMLPMTLVIAMLVKQPVRFLDSLVGRFRWKWFFTCALIALVLLGLNVGAELLIAGAEELDLRVRPHTWWLLVGLMLVTPFQAAAEEYMLRGVLFRTVGSWFRAPLVALGVGTVVNSGVFMLMHGASDPWLNLVYFVLGALLSWITWRTGGLEAAAAIHIVNNMVAFAIVPFQDVSSLFDRTAGAAGPVVLFQILAMVVIVVVVDRLAQRRRLVRLGPAPQG